MPDDDLTDEEILRENYFALSPGQKERLRVLIGPDRRALPTAKQLTKEQVGTLVERVLSEFPEVKSSVKASEETWLADRNSYRRLLNMRASLELLDCVFERIGFPQTAYRIGEARGRIMLRIAAELVDEGFNLSDPARIPIYRVEPRTGRDLEFRYVAAQRRLVSRNGEIYARFIQYLPERNLWMLHCNGKEICFLLQPTEIVSEHDAARVKSTNLLLSVADPMMSGSVSRYYFSDESELEEALGVIMSAVSAYDGLDEFSRAGTVAVSLSTPAKRAVQFGRLLRKHATTRSVAEE